MKRLQWTLFMLHTVVRKYKTAEKCPYCENRRYSMFYVCHYSWLLTSISFPPFFVIVQPLRRCVVQKVAQSAQHNATRQNMLQHLYVFSSKCEKPKPHHDRLVYIATWTAQDQVLTEWLLSFNTNTEMPFQTQQKVLTTSICSQDFDRRPSDWFTVAS